MKAFLVNLDKDKDRLAAADAQLKNLGIPYERVSAVYGADLSADELKRGFSAFRAYLRKGVRSSRGIIGCTLSHLYLYRRIVEENIPLALIMEDDVALSPAFMSALKFAEEHLVVSKPQVALLSDHTGSVHNRLSATFENPSLNPISSDMCTEAYLITSVAAEKLYRANYPMISNVDDWGRFRKRGYIELFHVSPPTAMQNRADFKTNIAMYKAYNGFCKCFRKGIRALELLIDEILFRITGR